MKAKEVMQTWLAFSLLEIVNIIYFKEIDFWLLVKYQLLGFLLEPLFLWQTAVFVTVEYIQKQTVYKEHQHIAIKKVVVAAYDKYNSPSLSSSYTHNFMKCQIEHENLQTPSKKFQ